MHTHTFFQQWNNKYIGVFQFKEKGGFLKELLDASDIEWKHFALFWIRTCMKFLEICFCFMAFCTSCWWYLLHKTSAGWTVSMESGNIGKSGFEVISHRSWTLLSFFSHVQFKSSFRLSKRKDVFNHVNLYQQESGWCLRSVWLCFVCVCVLPCCPR